jgi:hypothetical protein
VHNQGDSKGDLREYRHACAVPSWQPKIRRQPQARAEQRAQYAARLARAEFGRFYWNGELSRRMRIALQRRPKQNRDELNGKKRK